MTGECSGRVRGREGVGGGSIRKVCRKAHWNGQPVCIQEGSTRQPKLRHVSSCRPERTAQLSLLYLHQAGTPRVRFSSSFEQARRHAANSHPVADLAVRFACSVQCRRVLLPHCRDRDMHCYA